MRARLFNITDKDDLRPVMLACWDFVSQAIQSGALDVTVARESKTRAQEARYHAMIGDISRQVDLDGRKFQPDVWKAQLIDDFEHQKALMGEPLSKPGRVVMSLDKQRVVQIRPSSSHFRRKEASDFIEYLFAFGAEASVEWSDPETQSMYREYWERTA